MKYLSLSAIVYFAIMVLNLIYGNWMLIVIQSFLGASLFVATAIYVNTIDDENLAKFTDLELELKRLSKEVENLKK